MNSSSTRILLDAVTPHRLFSRLRIASKMLLGYLLLAVLSIAVVGYVLASLRQLNNLNSGIIRVDVPIRESADEMLDSLFAQDKYEKSSLIMIGRRDVRGLFWKRGEEFDEKLAFLKTLPAADHLPLKKLEKLHRQYHDLFSKETKLVEAGDLDGATGLSGGVLKNKLDQMAELLKTMSATAKQEQESKMEDISRLGSLAFMMTAALCVLSVVISVLSGLVVTNHIASSVGKLKNATARIAEGDFSVDPRIDTQDEIGDLSQAFRRMGQRLEQLEEMNRDASPLTRLPGGAAIENILKRRIASGKPFAFCLADLDNFKAFNDFYGYAHGNEVLKEAGRIIDGVVKAKGSPEDFVGHIGGDDFVVITTPALMRDIAGDIIQQFDTRIPGFYAAEDRAKGYIISKSRHGTEMRFPIITISIAIVTNEEHDISSPVEVSEIAAELKDHAKTITKSIFVVDKRRSG